MVIFIFKKKSSREPPGEGTDGLRSLPEGPGGIPLEVSLWGQTSGEGPGGIPLEGSLWGQTSGEGAGGIPLGADPWGRGNGWQRRPKWAGGGQRGRKWAKWGGWLGGLKGPKLGQVGRDTDGRGTSQGRPHFA